MKFHCSTHSIAPLHPERLCPPRRRLTGFSRWAAVLVSALLLFSGPGTARGQNAAWNTGSTAEPDGRSRTFNLYIFNYTGERIQCSISDTSCCDSPVNGGNSGWINALSAYPFNSSKLWIARVQGNGCDGSNGWFRLNVQGESSGLQDHQSFTFNNEGSMARVQSINRFNGILTGPSATTGAYFLSIYPADSQLAAPVDERLSLPRDRVAADSGLWGPGTTIIQDFRFTPVNGTQGNFYDSCAGVELFHPQHVVRLPNKNGRAYFMLSQSRAHNGCIQVLETYPGVLNPQTDLLNWTSRETRIGAYVWMDLYTGTFNGTLHPVGNWNHPGKMDLVGNVLAVAAQNWAEGAPCTYGAGNSEDAVLFYDVRDPRNPLYWGKITASQLNVPDINGMGMMRRPGTDDYELWITAGEGDDRVFVNWRTAAITPRIENWTFIGFGGDARQHGGFFSSYQLTPGTTYNGTDEFLIFLGIKPDSSNEFQFTDYGPGPDRHYGLLLPGADRHWVSESVYVTRQGMPVIYSMESDNHYGSDGILYQVHDTRNATLQTPHPARVVTNTNDKGPGSLRRAIGYGGNITFAPALNGQTISLTSGPLIAYQYDAAVDASALPTGISIVRQDTPTAPAFLVTEGNVLTQQGLAGLPLAAAGPVPWFAQTTTKHGGPDALQSGAVLDLQQTSVETSVAGPGTLTFWWKVSSEATYDFLRFQLDGAEISAAPRISGEVDWQQLTVAVPAGTHTLKWLYTKDGSTKTGSDAGWLDEVTYVLPLPTLTEALDNPDLPWSTPAGGWVAQRTTSHDGVDAAMSGAITHDQSTVLNASVTGPGTLTFWWKVSSELAYDFLRFKLNNAEVPSAVGISGAVDWQQITVPIPAGSHTLQWAYSKDGSDTLGSDAGWLDQVVFIPTDPTGAVVRFDATALSLANNTAVATWGTQTAGGTPTFQSNQTPTGKPAVHFDGTDRMGDNINVPAAAAQDFIIAAVIKPDSTGAYHNVVDDDAQTSPMLWVRPDFSYEMNFGANNTAAGTGTGGWDILIVDSRLNQIYRNSATANASGRDATAYATSRGFDFFHRDGAQTFRGKVAELRIYNNRAAFGGNFAALYNELRGKWIGSPYDTWAAANIPAGQDATFSGDANGNGLANGVEYALGTTLMAFTATSRIAAPAAIPADVDVYLDRSTTLAAATWTPVASWVNAAAPVFASGVSIVSGEIRDITTVPKAFYRYRVVKR